jgi:1-acyl-sn-glycerol-3-phosphate acyltransferase
MTARFVSAMFLLFICITSPLFFLIALVIRVVTAPFDRRLVCLHYFSSLWAWFYVWCMPAWSVTIIGREKLDWKKQYMIVSNHQSQLDILVAFGIFFPFKWISKAEVFKLPVIGWNMMLNRYIGLKRGDRKSVEAMINHCEQAMKQGCSLFFFPEGTRSRTGNLRPFKTGAFVLAKKMKTPIVPIAINGTMEALPKQSLVLNECHDITLEILDEIPYERFSNLDEEEIATRVRTLVSTHVRAHQNQQAEHA